MTDPAVSPLQTPSESRPWSFAARVGHVLVAPQRALARIDAVGGGLRDAVILALLGVLCFWMRDLVEALLGLSHLPLFDVLGRLLQLASIALREAGVVVLPAALGITIFAGRGRRDPSRDVELGAACYVPFFAVRGLERVLALDAFMGPLSRGAYQTGSTLAVGWALVVFVLALRLARARVPGTPTSVVPISQAPRWRWVPAASGLAAVLAVAGVVNGAWVLRNAHAVKPFGAGDAVPAFTLERANGAGGMVSLGDYKGKVVLLDFWASWCMPCLKLAPVLADLRASWVEQGFEVISINTDLDMPELKTFLEQHPAEYPVLVADAGGRVAERFKVVNLPHLVILDQSGQAAQTFWGYKSRAQLEKVVKRLLSAPSN